MDFVRLAPVLQSFTSLTALDLSCNYINLHDNESMAVIMKQAFSTLSKLERLDLSNNRLKNKLCSVLLGITHPLKHLRLAACGLTMLDITALAMFPFLESMEELDLSENNLSPCHFPIIPVLAKVSNSIKVLEFQECGITDEVMNMLNYNFAFMPKLLYLNLVGNAWCSETVFKLARHVARLPTLHVLRLSFPQDCYLLVGADEDEMHENEAKSSFRTSLNSALELTETNRQQNEKLIVVLDELNRTTE